MASNRVGGTLLLLAGLLCCITPCNGQVSFGFAVGNTFTEIPEEQPTGSLIIDFDASYFNPSTAAITFESGGTYSFTNSSAEDVSKFSLDSSTGQIRNTALLDRDADGAQTIFTLSVTFTTSSDDSGSTEVQISLLDINDNAPQFTQEIYEVSIAESTSPGVVFLNATALDPDQVVQEQIIDEVTEDILGFEYTNSNGRVLYSIIDGNELGHFTIGEDTGGLTVSSSISLDVDENDYYNITVLARDGGGLNNTATVLVTVLDSNDNQPQIIFPTSVEVTISEAIAPGFVVVDHINATDDDSGENAEIFFLILSGDLSNSFSIDSDTGELIVSDSLNREAFPDGVASIVIAARDKGIPPLEANLTVTINILDINDSPPQFTQSLYNFSISEFARINDIIGQVTAMDLDAGENGSVSYSILNNTLQQFIIDNTTGELFVNTSLDREEVPVYTITIEAVDNPLNGSLQLTATVQVNIILADENDNTPIWSQSTYAVGVLDNEPIGFEVITLLATDEDSGTNGDVQYQFFTPPDDDFAIDPITGLVTVNADIDLAIKPNYLYSVRAFDSAVSPRDSFTELNITIHTPNRKPPRFKPNTYSATLIETLKIGSIVLNVTATDPDPGLIGEVRYRIANESAFDEAGSFDVDPITGAVSVSSSLDFDFSTNISFMIEVYDGGFPEPLTDIANVTIHLLNANDEAPMISIPMTETLTVPENESPPVDIGSLIMYIDDRDPGEGGEFDITSLVNVLGDNSENNSFALNSTTGVVTALREFDREEQPEGFILQVLVTDQGTPVQSLVNNVTVVIGDRNDEAPYFEENVTATVYEFREPGELVYSNYTAKDMDIGINAELEYAVFDGDTFNSFTMSDTGNLYTSKVLNKTDQRFYNLTIIVMDKGLPPLTGFGHISVEVLDANDNAPIFIEPLVAFVDENESPETVFYTLNVTDTDEGTNARLGYYFAPNSTETFSLFDNSTNTSIVRFGINTTTGDIFTNDVFDREVDEVFNLTIIAVDMGLTKLTSTAVLTVHIQDKNDHSPHFLNDSYSVIVTENSPLDTLLLTVSAFDRDATPPNNEFHFNLTGSRSDELYIDPDSGNILVDDELDWEEGAEFTIAIIVTDHGNPPRESTVNLTVTILNVNDRAPEWVFDSLNISVAENLPVGAPVGNIVAIDPDSGANFSYHLATNFTSKYFVLNSTTGMVSTLATFDREEIDYYQLLVVAIDNDIPQQASDVETVHIQILDANDNKPIFLESQYISSISENTSVGFSVLSVQAMDRDIGNNSAVVYSIISSEPLPSFSINSITGKLCTDLVIDFEITPMFIVTVLAADKGLPSLSSTVNVTIFITDFNDQNPQFLQDDYGTTIEENIAVGTILLQVSATDNDQGSNAVIRYSLGDTLGSGNFGIDAETGVLYTAKQINREQYSNYTLMAIANNSLSDAVQMSTVPIVINVTDLNDQHPSFEIFMEVSVPENVTVDSVLFTLSATDGDVGPNGSISYTLIKGNDKGFFSLNSSSGAVTLVSELDYETNQLFFLTFNATDDGTEQLYNYTTVLVRILDSNDNFPNFSAPLYFVSVNYVEDVGNEVFALLVTDNDIGTNAESMFTITAGNEQGLFSIDSISGSILVNQSLTSHQGELINIIIMADNRGLQNTANVSMHIRGSGAEPYFDASYYQVSISESAGPGTEVIDLYTNTQPTGSSSFEILSGNEAGVFAISTDGALTANGSMVDYEEMIFYQLSVVARLPGGEQAYAIVNVRVNDVNDFPPIFPLDSFFAPFSEMAKRGESFFTILATDQDKSHPANAVSYSITSGNTDNKFKIEPATGNLKLNTRFDYNVDDRHYSLNITATNSLSVPALSSTATVEIDLLDANRHYPVFNPGGYVISLNEDPFCENVTRGLIVVNTSATDEDTGSNGDILYGLLGEQHHFVDFIIDTFNGSITVEECLDYERQNLYVLVPVASDRGSIQLTGTAVVTVVIVDNNDNFPQWEEIQYTVTIHENITIGTAIINVTATDADQVDFEEDEDGNRVFNNRNGYVEYSISDGDPKGQFMIDPDSGIVSIAAFLNREETAEYNLTLNATDGGGRYNNSYLSVILEDVNNFTPNFTADIFTADVPEDAPINTYITQVTANDRDLFQNANFSYRIEGSDGTFIINSTTGEVLLNRSLDRETQSEYSLTIEAVDMGSQPLTGSATLQIIILDLNEHPPSFSEAEYSADVSENESSGFSILQVDTTDEDFGENSTALYLIISGNEDELFAIDTSTGVISVNGALDFEEEEEYQLVVMATDSGPLATRLSTDVNVTIIILDENDNNPVFGEMNYVVYVAETTPPNSPLLKINVTDEDSDDNGEVIFTLNFDTDPTALDVFSINIETGLVSLTATASLDREDKDSYNISVVATDRGVPPLQATVPLAIFIQDNNDNAPVFEAMSYTGSIAENQPADSTVVSVRASDADIGPNGEIIYSITQIIQNQSQCESLCTASPICSTALSYDEYSSPLQFNINNETGEIVSARQFDREIRSQYILLVQATDSSVSESQLSSLVCVQVSILDENDNSPNFSQPLYLTEVLENSPTGEPVVTITANDTDEGENSDLVYSISEGSGFFTVHPTTGQIRTIAVFDREEQSKYNITLQAVDKGVPILSGTTQVTVAILDENDSAPKFSADLYEIEVTESTPIGSSVLRLVASDEDTDNYSSYSFSVVSSSPADHFSVNTTTGVLYTTELLNREAITSYSINVSVTDQKNHFLSSSSTVNITILDSNDNPPIFSAEVYIVEVQENHIPSHNLITVSATDVDIGTNGEVYYSIVSIDPPGPNASINNTSGELFLNSALDAELLTSYNITVQADNGPVVPHQSQMATVILEVLDVNDNTPQFEFASYQTVLSEGTPIGRSVLQLNANDNDVSPTNSRLMYSLTNSLNGSLFIVSRDTGLITVAGVVDRESAITHTLRVRVSDSGTPSLSSEADVTIIVTDENDNTPVFQQPSYSFSITENRPIGVSIGRVYATDNDEQNITYIISSKIPVVLEEESSSISSSSGSFSESSIGSTEEYMSGSTEGTTSESSSFSPSTVSSASGEPLNQAAEFFSIDSKTGEIFTAISFDREEFDMHSFIVLAIDGPEGVGRTAETVIEVSVKDVNDNSPSFSEAHYTTNWAENTAVGTELLTVQATDPDEGTNSSFYYAILPGNDSSFFGVSETTGSIVLAMDFDREIQNTHKVVVMATDRGEPPLNSTALITVYVLDINDNIPVLNQTQYRATLLEDTEIGTHILTAEASDQDINKNSDIRFSLSESFDDLFSIDEVSGVLSLENELDYELDRNYTFFIIASDRGDPQLMSSSEVIITVVDINDNSPTFAENIYEVSIPENSVLGTSVFHVPAVDLDSTSNGEMRYSILSGNFDFMFTLGEETGIIAVDGFLDRETESFYSIDVRVVDQGIPQFTATATVDITVTDTNDHAPQFSSKQFSATVKEDTPLNSTIFTLTASDDDINSNAELVYSITSGNSLGHFSVHETTGIITTTMPLDYEEVSSFSLSVRVQDKGFPQLFDSATLDVNIGNVNDNAPTITQANYIFNISQTTELGTPIAYLYAVDADNRDGTGGEISYSLNQSSSLGVAISDSGVLRVSNSILDSGEYDISVRIATGNLETSLVLMMGVLPDTYMGALFNPVSFLFELSESTPLNTIIGVVTTTGSVDSIRFVFPNESSEYQQSSTILNLFDIHDNGSLVLNGLLDREVTPYYVLNVRGELTSGEAIFCLVTIDVLDSNDNPPVFTSQQYEVALSEIALPSTTVVQVNAVDLDSPGPNKQAHYSITEGPGSDHFTVDPSTGVITVVKPLDREEQSSFELTINASNHLASPILYSTAKVVINVTDVNDNRPQFNRLFYQENIFQNISLRSEIFRFAATDPDDGLNSKLIYSVVHQSHPGAFYISPENGTLYSNISFLMFEPSTELTVSVMVSDQGSPVPQSDTAMMFITILKYNNYPPTFSQPNGYSVSVAETLSVGSSVLQVSAIDPDDNTTAVSYSITAGNTDSSFFISMSAGLITVLNPLNYQENTEYTLTVSAEDLGVPSRISIVMVNISIIDINNNSPQFNATEYQGTVTENTATGKFVTRVFATDVDAVDIIYTITHNFVVDDADQYHINESTGEIYTAGPIDREVSERIELLVSAIDTGYPIQRSTSVPVVVKVLDINDELPYFNQSGYFADAVRLLSAGQYVTSVYASDDDILGEELQFSIIADTSGGVFQIGSFNGSITTTQAIAENAANYTNLTVSVNDGKLNSTVLVTISIVDEGMFCDDGFCIAVRPLIIECSYTIPLFPVCESSCNPPYELTPLRKVCKSYSCLNDSLIPCNISMECFVSDHICGDSCPLGMQVCPATGICHPMSRDQPCATLPDTCLIGQTLVQQANGSRLCVDSSTLPPQGMSCTQVGMVFCEELLSCSNLSAVPLCQPCPTGLLRCPNTGACVSNKSLCCDVSNSFCELLDMCIPDTQQCRLPNIAPTISSNLILLETLTSYSPSQNTASSGRMIGRLLGNGSGLALDSQGEELGIAITELSEFTGGQGEWQYALCTGPISACETCSNLGNKWTALPSNITGDVALFLPNTACLRFWRKSLLIEGAAWIRARVWDGSIGGYLSNSSSLVRYQSPHMRAVPQFTNTSSVSEYTTLLVAMLQPLDEPPKFNSTASLSLPSINEDVDLVDNLGATMEDIVVSVDVLKLPVHDSVTVPGLPSVRPPLTVPTYQQLLPAETLTAYFEQATLVNNVRQKRLSSSNVPAVAVSLNGTDSSDGRWQVSLDGDSRHFVYLSDIISSNEQLLLLNTTSRLRFLPADNYHGRPSLNLRAWDGVAPSSLNIMNYNSFTAHLAALSSFSDFSLSIENEVQLVVNSVEDVPTITSSSAQLTPLPYLIRYQYQYVFTVLVTREIASMRTDREYLNDLLYLTLEVPVDVHRLYPDFNSSNTYMSFSVNGNTLNLTQIKERIVAKRSILSGLEASLPIISVSQDALYGPGVGCADAINTHDYPRGDLVSQLVNTFASDDDNDLLGMAVTGAESVGEQGKWQYLQGNWSNLPDDAPQNVESGLWINFPPSISETKALLLHGNDRVRYLPKPNYFWTSSSPTLTVKAWDNSIGSLELNSTENLRHNINTDPFVDTLQSKTNPIGHFSQSSTVVVATRLGCNGEINSGQVHDACCVCNGGGADCKGCDGTTGSNMLYNACDMCGSDESSCLGCDYVPFSFAMSGSCGQCVSRVNVASGGELYYSHQSFQDCVGVCFGTGLLDDCNQCSGGNTSHAHNSDKDCTGTCFGQAVVDTCDYCTGPGTNLSFNQHLDCAGVCNGLFRADSCNVCQLPDRDDDITNHRDCSGECFGKAQLDQCGACYGGNTGQLANRTMDLCGECNGDNSTCIGCDKELSSEPLTVDSCGNCGGNECGCFKINSISPARGPRTGGTLLTIKGAGFFLNTSSYNPSQPNCGIPLTNSDGTAITVSCQLRANVTGEVALGSAYIVDHKTIICATIDVSTFNQGTPDFNLLLSVANGPFASPVTFLYDDYSHITVHSLQPTQALTRSQTSVSFSGVNFINSTSIACLLEGFADCQSGSSSSQRIPAIYHSSSLISCALPSSIIPCQFKVYLSLDGQTSGRISSINSSFTFTYAHSAPKVASVHFAPGMAELIVLFDRQVELANNILLSCSAIFTSGTLSLLGSDAAQCDWTNTAQDEISIPLTTAASVQVNSPIEFKDNIIQTRGKRYSFTVGDTHLVSHVRNAVKPVAVLIGPTSIPKCGPVTFTAKDSLHGGYKGFTFDWSIHTRNALTPNFLQLTAALDSLTPTSDTISLSSDYFQQGVTYFLEVLVTNSMELSDRVTHMLMKDSLAILQISINGPAELTLQHDKAILLESDFITNECITLPALQFQWQLQKIVDTRRMLLENQMIPSDFPTTSSSLYIPASELEAGFSYTVTLSVKDSSSQFTAMRSVSLTILNNILVAKIYGGNKTVFTDQFITLDARTSTLVSSLAATVSYKWQCSLHESGAPCYNNTLPTPQPISLPQQALINLKASDLLAGQVYNFTLVLTQGNYSSMASILIEVVRNSTAMMAVEIVTTSSEVIATNEVTIEGLVWTKVPVNASWECVMKVGHGYVDVNTEGVAISQTRYSTREVNAISPLTNLKESIVTNRVNRVNLILSPRVLVPGQQYIFRLTALHEAYSSYAEVTLTVSHPPRSTTLVVQPVSGLALQTMFQVTVPQVTATISDQPLTYQFGVERGGALYWVTGPLTTRSARLLLPAGDTSGSLQVVARITSSNGVHFDMSANITVSPIPAAHDDLYQEVIQAAMTSLQTRKDVNYALVTLNSVLLNIDSTASGSIANNIIALLRDAYNDHIPVSLEHQKALIPMLQLLTSKLSMSSNTQLVITILTNIIHQLDTITNSNLGSTQVEPPLLSGVPSPLTSDRYGLEPLNKPVNQDDIQLLLQTLSNVAEGSSSMATNTAIVGGLRNLSSVLCKQMVVGEQTFTSSSDSFGIQVQKTSPLGSFETASGAIVDLGSALQSLHDSQACANSNTACSELCFQAIDYKKDYFSGDSQTISLNSQSSEKILSSIEGSDPSAMELNSDIASLDFSIPVENSFLTASNLATDAVRVYIPVRSVSETSGSTLLCIYRGSLASSSQQWQIDNLQVPTVMSIEGRNYYLCAFNHLTEFAVGILPPPVIVPPPSSTPLPPSSTPLPILTSSSVIVTPSPSMIPTGTPSIAGPVAAVLIVILLIVFAVSIIVIVVFILWKKKHSGKLKIAPEDVPSTDNVERTAFEKLTPEETKIPMTVIQLLENGERSRLGNINVIPSIRLRELRNLLIDNFSQLEKKPFYLCTKELCDIEPASEQQQFVSIVYSKAVFIREVKIGNALTKHQFCVCGKVAQFECSVCNAQGYCSQDCQLKHWSSGHQKDCVKLSEKKRRSEVLLRRQFTTQTLPGIPEHSTPKIQQVPVTQQPSSPTTWKSFLNTSRSGHLPALPKMSSTVSQQQPQLPETATAEDAATQESAQSPPADQSPEVQTPPAVQSSSTKASPVIQDTLAAPAAVQTPFIVKPPSRKSTSLPPLMAGRKPLSIGKLASQGTTPLSPKRPLFPPASRVSYGATGAPSRMSRQPSLTTPLPPLTMPGGRTLPVATPGSVSSYVPQTSLYGSYPSPQSPPYSQILQPQALPHQYSQAFIRTDPNTRPPLMSPVNKTALNRGWSVSSVQSTDLNFSTGLRRDIRNEPLLEHDEESSEEEDQATPATPAKVGRPPSLSVRKRSRMGSRKSDPSSSDTESSENEQG